MAMDKTKIRDKYKDWTECTMHNNVFKI